MENFKKDGKVSHRKHFTTRKPSSEGNAERIYSTDRSFDDEGPRPSGSRYGQRRSDGDRKPYGDRKAAGDRKPYGERKSAGDRKPRTFGDKPYGERKPYGAKPGPRKYAPKKDDGIGRMIKKGKEQLHASISDNDYVQPPVQEVVRLNKYIANSGVCSRREADSLIQSGCVTVNGEVVTELGTKVNVFNDVVKFNGETLRGEAKVYLVMNKPRGYVTTASEPHAEKTVMLLLRGCPKRVFPVGRLDKNTTGVLMFTNDGEMAEKLTHPSYDKRKIYQASLDRDLRQEDFNHIMAGVELSDGTIAADDLQYIDATDRRKIGIEIHSGKNRIVRRIFESLGYEVKALDRVNFAGLTKKGLKRGEWRFLTEGEVNILRMGAFK